MIARAPSTPQCRGPRCANPAS